MQMIRLVLCVIGVLVTSPCVAQVDGARRIPADNLGYPVLVAFGTSVSGSGFYVNTGSSFYLVTAKHVLYGADGTTLQGPECDVTSYARDPKDKTLSTFRLDLPTLVRNGNITSHRTQDIVVVKLGFVEADAAEPGRSRTRPVQGVTIRSVPSSGFVAVGIANIKRFAEVLVSNDVVVFGYPNSIGIRNTPQIDYGQPLLRKGIVAGTNEAQKTIVLDCPVYPGNSGGPVLEIASAGLGAKLRVIGVVIQYVPIVQNVLGA